MPRAFAMGNTPVINLGGTGVGGQGQGDAWIMNALDSMQARERDEAASSSSDARFRAQEFAKRLAALDDPGLQAKAAAEFATKDPEAGKLLTPYTQQLPETQGQTLRKTVGSWQNALLPQFLQTLQTNPEKVDPQLFMTMYPFLSAGDKGMDPGIVKFMTDRYISANEKSLPADFVQQYKYSANLEQTPQQLAQQGVEKRGQDVGFAGKKYEADSSFAGTKYGVNAKAPVYAAEAGMLGQKGRMYGTRADMNTESLGPDESQVDNHPLVQTTQAHINDLQKQRDQAAARVGNSKLPPAERADARTQARQFQNEIDAYQRSLTEIKTKMRKSLGIEEGDDNEPDAADSVGSEGGGPADQPQINDMRGSNVPKKGGSSAPMTPNPAAALFGGGAPSPANRPPTGAPVPQVRANTPSAAAPPLQQGPDPQLLMALKQRKAAGQKTLTQPEFQQLKRFGIDTSGWTVVGQ